MKETRWHWTAISLVAGGALLACGCTLLMARSLGPLQWGVYLGCVLILVGLFWFRRRMTNQESELEELRQVVTGQRKQQQEQQKEFEQVRLQVQAELEKQAAEIDRRQQKLTRQLANWHEWLEYPEPIDLVQSGNNEPRPPAGDDEQFRLLASRDRELNTLLEAEARILFENVRTNKYVVEGVFQPTLLRDDAYVLIEKVARIYVKDVQHPLQETSIDQLVRAASRVCLHLLVILEQLPVKVQHYNIRKLYGWIKQGVKAYGMYQSARPYMPYVNSAYYLSRYAMGSNPFSLLAWWVASEVTTRGASAAAQHLFNQKALALLNDVVRVIGYEVASMYGGDVRHRDANWIYAAELTELASEYPLSREGLVHAMKEVGALQLVNEYDRIFLFRCLAGGKSAEPGRYKAKVCLHTNERQAVVTRLEKFFRGFARAGSDKRYARWSAGVQERLGIKLHDGGSQTSLSPPDQAKDALRSLASFLVDVKQREGEELAELLTDSAVLSRIDASQRDELLNELAENPPFFFEQPELDPSAEIATVYLEDLARLAIVTPPRDVPFEPLLEEVAAYLRVTPSRIRKLMDQQYMQLFRTRCSENDSVSNATPAVARAFLRLGEMDERAQFTYHNIRLQWAEEANSDIDFGDDLWLVGTNQRLILLDAGEVPTILWVGEASDTLLEQSGQWAGTCIVSGGTWIAAPPDQPSPTIIVRARIHQRFQDYFGPLLRYCQSDQRSNIP